MSSGKDKILSLGDDQLERFVFEFYNKKFKDNRLKGLEPVLGQRLTYFKVISEKTFKVSFRWDFNQDIPKALNNSLYDLKIKLLDSQYELIRLWELYNCSVIKWDACILNLGSNSEFNLRKDWKCSLTASTNPVILDALFKTTSNFHNF